MDKEIMGYRKVFVLLPFFVCLVFGLSGCITSVNNSTEEKAELSEIQPKNEIEVQTAPSENHFTEEMSEQSAGKHLENKEMTDVPVSEESFSKKEETSDLEMISEDIYSFQILFDDELYSVPMSFSNFEKYGWKFTDKMDTVLKPEEYVVSQTWERDGIEIYTSIANFSNDIANIEECWITEMTFAMYMIGEKEATLCLPKDIVLGKSKKNDIIQAYGTPTDEHEGDETYTLVYSLKHKKEVKLIIDKENELLDRITISNFTKPPIDSMEKTKRDEM